MFIMKKRSISLIIGLMSVALLGVMAMQLYFLEQSYNLKAQLFDQSVNEALNKVASKVEKYEAYNIIKKRRNYDRLHIQKTEDHTVKNTTFKTPSLPININKRKALLLAQEQEKADSLFNIRDSIFKARHQIIAFNEMSVFDAEPETFDVKIDVSEYQDAFGGIHQQSITSVKPRPRVFHSGRTDSIKRYVIMDPVKGPQVQILKKPKIHSLSYAAKAQLQNEQRLQKQKELKSGDSIRAERKKAIFEDVDMELKEVNIPLKQRINPFYLDSMLNAELQNTGINISYAYRVSSARNDDSLIFKQASNSIDFLPDNTYKTVLFPNDMIRDAGMLMITFPAKNSVILSNMGFMMGSSGALLLILLFCFGFTILSIIRQKKISEMKTDFINNMTHEFKTPVATIMIASEALKDPEVTEDKQRISRLAGIIFDENIRLGNHIERVLNIAKIDKGDLKLEFKEVEMNDLIAAVADSMQLQFQKKGAKVNINLNATKSSVNGDELHLSNVIYNLIDNALKYSKNQPQISISSQNNGKNLIIKVADKGIGMNKDELSKIFGQFYRVSTGNLHDVKGFGLGLSYVNNIVKRHKGSIKVKSEKDKGSEFEITFVTN